MSISTEPQQPLPLVDFERPPVAAPRATTAEPILSVRLGKRITEGRWPAPLEPLRTATKRLAWLAVEAKLVRSPARYVLREVATSRRGVYALRSGSGRFSVRHRSGDIDILRKFYAYGYYDLPAEVDRRLRELRQDVRVVDLGANIGFFDVYLRDRLPVGHTICVEPDPANAAVLAGVRDANAADWELVRACASNRAGVAMFNTGRKNFSRISDDGDTAIPTIDVFPLLEQADLVKMNIEGSEWDILRDPRLAQTANVWIVEYHRIGNCDPDIHGEVVRLFERVGYTTRLAMKTHDNGLLWAWRA